MKNFTSHAIFALFVSYSMTSCLKNDVFDSEYYNDKFIVNNVNENFDWSMFSSVKLKVSSQDNYAGKYYYRIDVYDSNPMVNENASLFAVGVCKKDLNFETNIIVPSSLERICVVQTAPNGVRVMKEYEITKSQDNNISIECDFNINDNQITKSLKSSAISKNSEDILTDYNFYDVPSDAIIIDSNNNIDLVSNKSYLIPNGFNFSGKFNFAGKNNVKIYVQGVWSVDSNIDNTSNDIIVLNGGKLIAQDNITIELKHSSNLAIQENGSIITDGNSSKLILNNQSSLFNNGNVSWKGEIYIPAGGNIFNNDKILVRKLETRNSNTKISNNGSIESTDVSLNQAIVRNNGSFDAKNISMEQGSFDNIKSLTCEKLIWNRTFVTTGCHLYSDYISTTQANISIASQSIVKCLNWDMTGSKINLDSYSVIYVGNTLKMYSENSFITNLGNNYSLLISKKIDLSGYKTANFSGKLGISTDYYYPGPNQWNPTYTATSDVLWSDFNNVPVQIPSNDCFEGIIPGEGTSPEDPKFPIVEETINPFTFVMEDNFPHFGDYDMNDIVLGLTNQKRYINSDNKVESISLDFSLKAVGATKQLAMALQLDEISKNNIRGIEVVGRDLITSNFQVINNLENNQNKPVIILFDDAHKLLSNSDTRFPLNTTYVNKEYKTISLNIEFNEPVISEKIDINSLNIFGVIFNNNQRLEIHAPGYSTTSLYSSQYPSLGAYMWALKVPSDFKFPCENISITQAYPDFTNWVESNKSQNQNWYENPVSDKVLGN